MIWEYCACFIQHSAWRWVHIYFQDAFELSTAEHKLLGLKIPHLVADSTCSDQIVSLDTRILYDEKTQGKGIKLNIPWL